VAREYLAPLVEADIDTLVFGCTHYPHLEGVFRQILPAHVRYVDPASFVVKAASQELEILGLRHTEARSAVNRDLTKFYVSGDPEQFAQISSRWLNKIPMVEQVELSPVELLS
jgi:glutamate racemase